MADYVVTTRNADGSLIDRAYTANDRADLFKKLAADGLSAVRVREGALGKKPRRVKSGGAPSKGRGLIAAAIVILGVGAAVWFLMPKTEKPVDEKNVSEVKTIGEAKVTAINTNRTEKQSVAKRTSGNSGLSLSAQRSRERIRRRNERNGIRDFIPPAHTSSVVVVNAAAKHFVNPADQWVAIMLTAPLGERPIGDPQMIFGEKFRSHFAQSAATKIEIYPDDPDEVKELKQAVIDTKKDLFSRVRNGEDPCEIMKATFHEMQQLGLYKAELEAAVKAACLDNNLSDQEVEDTLTAANSMLSERGITNLKMPGVFKRRLKMRARGLNK